jgi:hypothetical protein
MSDPAPDPAEAELDRHRGFQERFWRVERLAWLTFLGLVIVALLGLTGSGGLLARAQVAGEAGVVEFPRITRWASADQISFRLAPGPVRRRIVLSRPFFFVFQIEAMLPEPESSTATKEGLELVFAARPQAPVHVELHVRARKPGLGRFAARLDGGAPLDIPTLVLP